MSSVHKEARAPVGNGKGKIRAADFIESWDWVSPNMSVHGTAPNSKLQSWMKRSWPGDAKSRGKTKKKSILFLNKDLCLSLLTTHLGF